VAAGSDVPNIIEYQHRMNFIRFVQEDQALQARAQSLSALVSLCKALGGGWTD
jgi:hypothetical protein